MKRVPEVGERVRLEVWRSTHGCSQPWPAVRLDGTLDPDWRNLADPEHTGAHEVVAVHPPDPMYAGLGTPLDEPTVELRCGEECPCSRRKPAHPFFPVGVGALHEDADDPTLLERLALAEARAPVSGDGARAS